MRRLVCVPILLLASLAAAAPPPLTLPPQVTGAPGAFVQVPATTAGKSVRWVVLDQGLNLFPVALLADSHTAVVSTATPGTYRLLAVTAAADEVSDPAVCVVVIQPPTPAPTPGPQPPAPTDPLVQAVAAAYAGESSPAKASQVSLLAALYQQGATTTANDATLRTLGDLQGVLARAGAALVAPAELPKVRTAVGAYLVAQLGTDPGAALDATLRARAAQAFGAVATVLGGLK